MNRPLNLPQLAHAYRAGTLKLDGLPEARQRRIKAFADSVPAEELEAMVNPKPRAHFGFQRASGNMTGR